MVAVAVAVAVAVVAVAVMVPWRCGMSKPTIGAVYIVPGLGQPYTIEVVAVEAGLVYLRAYQPPHRRVMRLADWVAWLPELWVGSGSRSSGPGILSRTGST